MGLTEDFESRKDNRAILKARTKAFKAAVRGLEEKSPNGWYAEEVSRMRHEFKIDHESVNRLFSRD